MSITARWRVFPTDLQNVFSSAWRLCQINGCYSFTTLLLGTVTDLYIDQWTGWIDCQWLDSGAYVTVELAAVSNSRVAFLTK